MHMFFCLCMCVCVVYVLFSFCLNFTMDYFSFIWSNV